MNINSNYLYRNSIITSLFFAFFFCFTAYGQISITGASTATVGDLKSFSLSSSAGTDTQWFIAGGSSAAVITQSNQNAARVRFDESGSVTLRATILNFGATLYNLSFHISVCGGNPQTPNAPQILTNTCGEPVLQRVGLSLDTGDKWYWQGKNANGTSTSNGSAATYTVTEGNGTYYIRARSCGGEWSSGSGSIAVTVNNLDEGDISVTAGGIFLTRTICYNTTAGNLRNFNSATNGDGSYAYQWQESTNNSTWTNIPGATGTSYNQTTNLTSDRWYRREVTSCGQSLVTDAIHISIDDPLEPGSINGIAKTCYGGDPPALTNAGSAYNGDGSYSYQWQTSTDNQNWTNISGATQNSYDLPPNFIQERWYRRVVSSCGQTAQTASVLVEVWPELFGGDISGNQTICYGEDPTVINNAVAPSGGKGVYVYSWQSSPDGINNWTTINGAISATYNPPANQTATKYYRRGVNSCDFILYTPTIVSVMVEPQLQNPTGTTNVDVCTGESASLVLTPDTNANSIRWYDVASGGTHLAIGTIFSTPELSINTSYYAVSYNTEQGCESATRTRVDVNMVSLTTYYLDADNDGLGDPAISTNQCEQPMGYVLNATDNCPNINDPSNACTILPPSSDPQDYNYIYTRTYQKSAEEMGITTSTDLPFFTENDALIQQLSFFDGLGRPLQQLGIDQSPDKDDVVSYIGYDKYGRQQEEYLPYSVNDVLGQFNIDAKSATLSYYNTTKYENTLNPFSQKDFESSPANRVLKQAAPGNDWALGQGHEIGFTYGFSSLTDNVRHFEVSLVQTGDTYAPTLIENALNPIYGNKQLHKNVTRDENYTSGNDHSTEEYINMRGRVVLKRTYNADIAHDTYYVYDDHGNLAYVLPPLMNASDAARTIANLQADLDDLGYQYTYDHRNRLVEKKIPGKGWEHIIYNKLDQPIMTQDAVQRTTNEWLFTKYDVFGRVAYTGKATDARARDVIQTTDVDALTTDLWVVRDSGFAMDNITVGYGNTAYPTTTLTEVLTVNYYDDYNFDRANESAPPALVFGESIDDRTKGLSTGSKVKVLDPAIGSAQSKWITIVSRYDDKARPIYVYSENDYLSTVDIIESDLDFVGKPLKVRTAHTRSSSTIATLDNFEYDHVGRLLKQTQCLGNENLGYDCSGTAVDVNLVLENTTVTTDQLATNSITISPVTTISGDVTLEVNPSLGGSGGPEELIVYNQYDELGQMDQKKVGGAPGTTYANTAGLQTVDYTYNVRGWLKSINQDANADNDLFNFGINYNTVAHGGTPLFNGNISETEWETSNDNTLRWYTYGYDALNRITNATGSSSNYNLGLVQYDKNGNIERLTRNGHTDANATSFGLMDDLTYTYTGNQLQAVDDAPLSSALTGFVDGVEQATEYTYDGNGNMKTDANKGITGIDYNHLNLPTNIAINGTGGNGTIDYIYNATGTKLKKTVGSSVTEYAGNYVYSGGNAITTIQFFNQPEGYVKPDGQGGYSYVYQYKDHLGNVRLSYADGNGDGDIDVTTNPTTNEMVEENNYYPFGLQHKGYNDGMLSSLGNDKAQQWKFGGKEYDESLGLETYDFGARNYNPDLGRWMNLDPLAEKFFDNSPYVYARNNPIFFVDPDGNEPIPGPFTGRVIIDKYGTLRAFRITAQQRYILDLEGSIASAATGLYGAVAGLISAHYSSEPDWVTRANERATALLGGGVEGFDNLLDLPKIKPAVGPNVKSVFSGIAKGIDAVEIGANILNYDASVQEKLESYTFAFADALIGFSHQSGSNPGLLQVTPESNMSVEGLESSLNSIYLGISILTQSFDLTTDEGTTDANKFLSENGNLVAQFIQFIQHQNRKLEKQKKNEGK
ncbi:RHS repeat-associated core domain-containing protein [Flagellimonas hymeniacidonis]|uniref:RHS repeat-associated core domain-containing protein n=1 Tax=Flagellimonas hymeniacidonis TaxID=2603628 RepID=A0A5C8V521_9FLAO|nr:DUF6443 domain-containing protein [Flagellimonas hymeniacidonis]TXN36135.1 RHS repeat-associated core domain-containing protein [Flagellimonas hymeniacidonis]